jgi:hypothetical protein
MRVIFKKLEFLNKDETPSINGDMEHYFDGKTVREVSAKGRYYGYHGWNINDKWFDEYNEHDDIEKLFELEL